MACTLPDHGLSHEAISHSIRWVSFGLPIEGRPDRQFPAASANSVIPSPRLAKSNSASLECSASDRPNATVANMASVCTRAAKVHAGKIRHDCRTKPLI